LISRRLCRFTAKNSAERASAGFSLVELMVVIGIIGILVMLARPKVMGFVAKAKISEAKIILNQISVLQEAFFAEQSRYTLKLDELGYTATGKHYSIIYLEPNTDPSFWWVAWVNSGKALCPGVISDSWTTGNLMAGKYVQCAMFPNKSVECFTDCPTCHPDWQSWKPPSALIAKCY
jgi:prepilin-type N-terminal cleavage/methylation domain-containing protein